VEYNLLKPRIHHLRTTTAESCRKKRILAEGLQEDGQVQVEETKAGDEVGQTYWERQNRNQRGDNFMNLLELFRHDKPPPAHYKSQLNTYNIKSALIMWILLFTVSCGWCKPS